MWNSFLQFGEYNININQELLSSSNATMILSAVAILSQGTKEGNSCSRQQPDKIDRE